MKVSPRSISIPPYISTQWSQVGSLHTADGLLLFTLKSGETVYVPNLTTEQIGQIFAAHTDYLEQQEKSSKGAEQESTAQDIPPLMKAFRDSLNQLTGGHTPDVSFRISNAVPEQFHSALQHDPKLANSADLPHEILERLATISHNVAPEFLQLLPQPEPHCNCPYCQVAHALTGTKPEHPDTKHDDNSVAVDDADLRFTQWEVQEVGDKLFSVTNKLDPQEVYRVFLGSPVGCTCGKSGCEHIVAVLQS